MGGGRRAFARKKWKRGIDGWNNHSKCVQMWQRMVGRRGEGAVSGVKTERRAGSRRGAESRRGGFREEGGKTPKRNGWERDLEGEGRQRREGGQGEGGSGQGKDGQGNEGCGRDVQGPLKGHAGREGQGGEDREGEPAAVRSWVLRAFNTQGAVLHRRLVHVVLSSCFQNKSKEPW